MAKRTKGNKYYVGNPNRHVFVIYTAVQFMMLFMQRQNPKTNIHVIKLYITDFLSFSLFFENLLKRGGGHFEKKLKCANYFATQYK